MLNDQWKHIGEPNSKGTASVWSDVECVEYQYRKS